MRDFPQVEEQAVAQVSIVSVGPEEATAVEATAENVASEDVASENLTSADVASENLTSEEVPSGEPRGAITNLLAKAISLLFHPLMMALWMTILVMWGYASQLRFPMELRRFVVTNVAITTILIPLIFNLMLRLFGVERGGVPNGRKVVTMRLLIAALCYACCGFMFTNVPLLFLVRKMLYLGAIVLLLAFVMEFIRPLAHHPLAYGALLGYMWVLLFVGNMGLLYPFMILLIVGGLLLTSRLYLTDDSPRHLYFSLMIGTLVSVVGAIFV